MELTVEVTITIPDSWISVRFPPLSERIRTWVDPEGLVHRLDSRGRLRAVRPFQRGRVYEDGHIRLRFLDDSGIVTVRPAPHICRAVHGDRPEDHILHYRDGDPGNISPANLEWVQISS